MIQLRTFTPALALLTWTASTLANTEPPSAYDARSVGMGSTGVAHVTSAAAVYHNPALLDGVERGAVTGVFSPLAPQVFAPLEGPDTEVKSTRSLGPLFLLGGAYRVHERVTLGLAAYPTLGFGARFEELTALGGLDLLAQLSVLEIAPGASVALTDWLSLGVAYRVSRLAYAAESPVLAPPPAPDGTLLAAEAEMSGWNFLGAHVGLLAHATDSTRLGFSYRNKIRSDLEGTTTLGGAELDSSMEFAVPHIFKLGVAQELLEGQLLLALDLRYALYAEANESLIIETEVPGVGQQQEEIPLDWKNSVGAHLGAEFRPEPSGLGVRAGYSLARSATPDATAQPVMPPPGLHHAVHVGAGWSTPQLDLDLGGYYLFGGKHAEPDALPAGSRDGDYRFNAILGSLSLTYRFGAAATGRGGEST